MIIRLLVPLGYSILAGGAWACVFKKKFSSSLAPGFMFHVLLVLLSGLLFNKLSYGIWGGIVLGCVILCINILKNRSNFTVDYASRVLKQLWNEGLFIFVVFYLFCFFSNHGKRLLYWDEFSHWGLFIKETLRLDAFYCTSTIDIFHKDYVPAVTLFETIWCRLNFRYMEADVYRAIQILMFSMILPVFEKVNGYVVDRLELKNSGETWVRKHLFQVSELVFVMLLPLIFNTKDAFYFYHSIYNDMALGVIFFWCIYEIYVDYQDLSYQLFALMIGLSMMVLSKMTAMALLPLAIGFLVAMILLFSRNKFRLVDIPLFISNLAVPVGLWAWFNKYVDKYIPNEGSIQSYDGMSLSSLKNVFTSPENSTIPYLGELKKLYIDAIIHNDILLHGSYVAITLFIVIAFCIMAMMVDIKTQKRRIVLIGMWTAASTVFYGVLMYFLYATAFGEGEAMRLASFERYMNSFVVSFILLLVAVYYDSELWIHQRRGYYICISMFVLHLLFGHISAVDQMLPGDITNDEDAIEEYIIDANSIMSVASDGDRVFCVRKGDIGDYMWHLRYYCDPLVIGGGSIGPASEGDNWSRDLTTEELVNELKDYDIIYFSLINESFIDKYYEIFDKPELLVDGGIYRINVVDSKVIIE